MAGKMKKFLSFFVLLILSCGLLLGTGCKQQEKPGETEKQERVYAFDLGDVVLGEGMLLQKQQQNEAYLKSLSVDKLMYFFYQTAGVPVRNQATPYGGWEAGNTGWSVAGHTLGHYLSAVSMTYAETKDEWFLNTANDIVAELKKCQQSNGYVFTRAEGDFNAVLNGRNDNGVMFYTVHKILAGLLDAYKYTGNQTALQVASDLTDWVYSKTGNMNEQQIALMLGVEYGGMNEVCYCLYEVTKKAEHLKVAEIFNERSYLKSWAEGVDNLAGKHANTQIPKAAGFAKGYMLTGNEELLKAAKFFWEIVVNQRTFATGGNAENEHFGAAGVTSDQIYYNPDETCNIYNMCKLSSYLYEITGEGKYADYMERALLNGIAGSIDEDGCKTYYQWLSTDAKKLFHSEEGAFWCCTGTGMESFSKLACTLGYKTEKGVRINTFQSATYKYGEVEFKVESSDEMNKITFVKGGTMRLQLRVPYYADYTLLQVNGVSAPASAKDGYITLERTFNAGDVIDYQIVYKVYTESTNDKENVVAVKYGPYLLAAVGKRYEKKNYFVPGDESLLSNLKSELTLTEEGFELRTKDGSIPMKKYCDVTNETYTTYFQVVSELPNEAKTPDLAMRATPFSDLGYSVTHADKAGHNVWYEASGSCTYLEAMNDGVIGTDSLAKSEFSNDLFAYYVPFVLVNAGTHHVGYNFDTVQKVRSVSLYFYDNYAMIKAPESYKVQYFDGSNWVDVANPSEATTKRNQFNTVTFDEVTTAGIRVVMTSGKQMGVIEMKVN